MSPGCAARDPRQQQAEDDFVVWFRKTQEHLVALPDDFKSHWEAAWCRKSREWASRELSRRTGRGSGHHERLLRKCLAPFDAPMQDFDWDQEIISDGEEESGDLQEESNREWL